MSEISNISHCLSLLHKWQRQRRQANKQCSNINKINNDDNPRINRLQQLTHRDSDLCKSASSPPHTPIQQSRVIDNSIQLNPVLRTPHTSSSSSHNTENQSPNLSQLKLLKARNSLSRSASHDNISPVRRNSSPITLQSIPFNNTTLAHDRQQSLPSNNDKQRMISLPTPLIIPNRSASTTTQSPLRNISVKPTSAGITRSNRHVNSIEQWNNLQTPTKPASYSPMKSLNETSDINIDRCKNSMSKTINQLRQLHMNTNHCSGSDTDTDTDTECTSSDHDNQQHDKIEYGYLMNKRRFTNWISHKQLLQIRQSSLSFTPNGAHTPINNPTADVHTESASARLSKWVNFQIKMHSFVKQWRKSQQHHSPSTTITPNTINQLKSMESEFLSIDLTEQIMTDKVDFFHGTDSPTVTRQSKQAQFLQSIDMNTTEYDTIIVDTVDEPICMNQHHHRTDTPVNTFAPIELHDYVDTNNDTSHTNDPVYDDVIKYAKYLQFELPTDEPLLHIARQALKSPVPTPWRLARAFNILYYVNVDTHEVQFSDPSDNYYYMLYQDEKYKYWMNRFKQCFLNSVQYRIVNCSAMNITDRVFQYLCNTLKHNSDNINVLDLSHNLLTDVSISKLCKLLLHNTHTIHTINLAHNQIGAHSLIKLTKLCTHSTVIHTINLSYNISIGTVGIERIAKLLTGTHCKLQYLDISNCGINNQSIQYIIDIIQFNKSLMSLNISNNDINTDNIDKLLFSAKLCKQQLDIIT